MLFLVTCDPYKLEMERKRTSLKKRGEATPVTVLEAKPKEIPYILHAWGRTEVSDRFELTIPEGERVVTDVLADVGQRVSKGEVLLRLDVETLRLRLDLARAEIDEAEGQLEESRSSENNKEPTGEEEEKTPKEPEEEKPPETDEGEPERKERKKSSPQATLDRAKKEVALLEKQVELAEVTSPINGVVTKRDVSVGETVGAGRVLMQVLLVEPLYFTIDVPLEVIGFLKKGDFIPIKFPDLKGQEITGEVVSIGAEAGIGGTIQVKLSIPNDSLSLVADMEGEVNVTTSHKEKAILLPEEALVKKKRGTYVFKVKEDRVKRTSVVTGSPYAGETIITRGVDEGDQIVISDPEGLIDGARVAIQDIRRP